MCDRESFAKIRDAIGELQKADAVQSEQIKTLFKTTEAQGESQKAVVNRLLWIVAGVLALAVLALIFGALGEHGFNAVVRTSPKVLSSNNR